MIHLHGSVTDWQEYQELVSAWDLSNFVLTDRGTEFAGGADIALADQFFVTRAYWNRGFMQRGGSPEGFTTFALLAPGSTPVTFKQQKMVDCIALYDSQEFESASLPGFDVFTVGFEENFFTSQIDDLDMVGVENSSESVVVCSQEGLARLQVLLAGVLKTNTDTDSDSDIIARSLLAALVAAPVRQPDASHRVPSTRARQRALSRSLEYIDANKQRTVTIGEICRHAAASERTLEYAFREYCGVTPKFYLNSRRLHALRDALSREDGSEGVADIASRFDYWHMGKLAADYRALFGELPSETLRRRPTTQPA
jgi:AraC-like DNA-binding protein